MPEFLSELFTRVVYSLTMGRLIDVQIDCCVVVIAADLWCPAEIEPQLCYSSNVSSVIAWRCIDTLITQDLKHTSYFTCHQIYAAKKKWSCWTFPGQLQGFPCMAWDPCMLVYKLDMLAGSLPLSLSLCMCDHVEDGWLFAGYCCPSCLSLVVSLIEPLRLALSCYSLGSREEEEVETKARSGCAAEKDLPHHLAWCIEDRDHVTGCLPLQQA